MADRTDPERLASFVRSVTPDLPEELAALAKECEDSYVPLIRSGTQAILRTMLALTKPEKILEVGTGIGFSALFMAHYSDAEITTIEHAPERIRIAGEHFAEHCPEGRITLLPGDAQEILPELTGPYDFIFMDAAKGQYRTFFPEILRLLRPGGLLVTDNVIRGGDILESHYTVPRRLRTIHKRMREYLRMLMNHPALTTTILSEGDGVALSVKKENPVEEGAKE